VKVLITGAAGFIGSYLSRHCVEAGCSVLGIDIREQEDECPGVVFDRCDVRNATRLSELLKVFRPDCIFHLAAQSYPTVSLSHPLETMDTNAGGTIALFECLRVAGMKPVVVVACSSAEYGPVGTQDSRLQESDALHPLHPYGVSKVAQDLLSAQYFANFAIPTIRIRIFKTTGPGKLGDVCSDLAKRVIEIEKGRHPAVVAVGNLASRRSIVDVRDLVSALWLSVKHCTPGEVYNLGGDDIYSVQELVHFIRAQVAFSFEIEQSPELMRSCDEPVTAGDNTKFRSCCSWTPQIGIAPTLRDMLEWWRVRLESVGSRTLTDKHEARSLAN
jgi:GDP-4-dehydro-6-deoxy-D-mannose reductase